MGVGEDEIRHEDPAATSAAKGAAKGGEAPQSPTAGTDAAAASDQKSAPVPRSSDCGSGAQPKNRGVWATLVGLPSQLRMRAGKRKRPDAPASGKPLRPGRGASHAKPEAAKSNRPEAIAAKAIPPPRAGQAGSVPSHESAASADASRSWHFASLAAAMVLAAGAGAFLGALTAGGFAHRPPASAADPGTAEGRRPTASYKAQLAELSALKASLERVNRSTNAQLARIGQRLESLEHAQAAPAAKLAHMADALDRLEKERAAPSDVTGSIADNRRSKESDAAGSTAGNPRSKESDAAGSTAGNPRSKPSDDATGSSATDRRAKQSEATGSTDGNDATAPTAGNPRSQASQPSVPVLRSWVVDEVRNRHAMVESRYGDVFVVGTGSVLPGLGRVEQIKQQDGRWVVVTASGLITSAP